MKDIYKFKTSPMCHEEAVIKGDKYRFTVLTPTLIRIEYSENGEFEDRATQTVINRDFEVPAYSVIEEDGVLTIRTECMELHYAGGVFSPNTLTANYYGAMGNFRREWRYGDSPRGNLMGTTRTLDGVNGECKLDYGLMTRDDMYLFDDSNTLVLDDEGWVDVRDKNKKDMYLFAYAKRYLECLKVLYHLTGKTPLLPRFALGNWWSRYHEYTQEEYVDLMEKFQEKQLPFSVAVIDMDWHKVKIEPKYGSGWTGFSWERKLFPEPEKMLEYLHENKMKVSLNLHPAEGIYAHEDTYTEMAKAMGVDYKNEEKVAFDIANPKFVEAYFEHMLHPLEEGGVDFWWMDWQQGNTSKVEGLDPLWMLNHYHYLDNARDGKRPMAFSRYSGVGSHRYPVGFSGDTHVTWESLDFQPYFTATASNVGYGWWSHDIGGHMGGVRDDELTARWVQLGVFSPIMRLHSTSNPFVVKEPWNFGMECEKTMSEFLRLRHKLVPYLYSMNYEASYNDSPLVQPLYYQNPDAPEAYAYRNEYHFGTQMVVAPITKKADSVTEKGNVSLWLPEGDWYDFFNMTSYKGDRAYKIYRSMNEMPVFVKAGGIIPMAELDGHINDTSNPKTLRIAVYPGADNTFDLYEDDDTISGNYALTKLALKWGKKPSFDVIPPKGGNPYAPDERGYVVEFKKVSDADVNVTSGGKAVEFTKSYENDTVTVTVENISGDLHIEFVDETEILKNDYKKMMFDTLLKAQVENDLKTMIYNQVCKMEDVNRLYEYLEVIDADENLKSMIREIVSVAM